MPVRPVRTTAQAQALAARRKLRVIVCRACGTPALRLGTARYCSERCTQRIRIRRWRRARRAAGTGAGGAPASPA